MNATMKAQSCHKSIVASLTGLVLVWAALAVLTLALVWWLAQQPMVVPDTASPPASNHLGRIYVGNQVGQSFVAELNNLTSVSLVLATEEVSNAPTITFILREDGPTGRLIRSASLPISSLPEGSPFDFRPSSLTPRWTAFEFDPIPDSAGRSFYFAIEGSSVPEKNQVGTLMMFFNKYPRGKAYVNAEAQNANLVFRTHSHGQVGDYLNGVGDNLTLNRQGILGSPATYVALGALYSFLLVVLFWSVSTVFKER